MDILNAPEPSEAEFWDDSIKAFIPLALTVGIIAIASNVGLGVVAFGGVMCFGMIFAGLITATFKGKKTGTLAVPTS